MGPGNAGGRALLTPIFYRLMFQGGSNGCIGSDLLMGRGTMHPFHGIPTTLVHRGICR
jgi:hypothetical protein